MPAAPCRCQDTMHHLHLGTNAATMNQAEQPKLVASSDCVAAICTKLIPLNLSASENHAAALAVVWQRNVQLDFL